MNSHDEVVIISEAAYRQVSLLSGLQYATHISEAVPESMKKSIEESARLPLKAVIYICADEFDELVRELESLEQKKIVFKIVLVGNDNDYRRFNSARTVLIADLVTGDTSKDRLEFVTGRTFTEINEKLNFMNLNRKTLARLADTKQDQDDLINIGKSLSSEKDPDKLLRLILDLSKKITGADAGSIYLVERDENGNKRLRFKYSHTYSRDIPLEEFVMDMNKESIAGYVAVTGEVLNIEDAYKLPSGAPYSFNKSFDQKYNYICRSMLVVPMRNHIDEITGVIQLINSKEELGGHSVTGNEAFTIILDKPEDFERHVTVFDEKYDSLLEAIAGQAGISIENNRLIRQIQNQFREFVKASVTAIESRDPATSGHSFRVADVCREMAYAVNKINEGYLKDYFFDDNAIQELEFAALLHDFGKVYIDNSIFKKEKKLYPKDFENLNMRIEYLYRYIQYQYNIKEMELISISDPDKSVLKEIELLSLEMKERLDQVGCIKEKIALLNEPTVLDVDPEKELEDILREISDIKCLDINGNILEVISDFDRLNLTTRRGSLNPLERKEIETHVVHTHSFVSKIPWPPEYRKIPDIALRHHEALDGSGYPDGLKGRESTSLQSRMMAIADIFDALSAHDRPYKKAVPIEKVMSILNEEAERGKLDPDLVDVFISNKIYEKC
jgi:HD-GYP domain-containing protein (c-di-GMP phosphodiesterase class II)